MVEEAILVAKEKGKVQSMKHCGAYSGQILGSFNSLILPWVRWLIPDVLHAKLGKAPAC